MDQAADERRRRARRISHEAIVHYQIGQSEFVNLSSNVSSDGIFIKNFSPPPVGTKLKIKVQLPGPDEQLQVHLLGEVVRVVDSVGVDERGMGVQFTAVQADSPKAIHRFVADIYEIEKLPDSQVSLDPDNGEYSYSPEAQEVLRFNPQDPLPAAGSYEGLSQHRLLKSLLLVVTGILLGGGLVLLFFLVR
jgi:hypothetical protein